jgi:hypothetical protein
MKKLNGFIYTQFSEVLSKRETVKIFGKLT